MMSERVKIFAVAVGFPVEPLEHVDGGHYSPFGGSETKVGFSYPGFEVEGRLPSHAVVHDLRQVNDFEMHVRPHGLETAGSQ